MNRITLFSESSSSNLAFFSQPGGGNGKQRDIAQYTKMSKLVTTQNQKCFSYFPAELFRKGNEPETMLLSMHHVPTFISSFNITSSTFVPPARTKFETHQIPVNFSFERRRDSNNLWLNVTTATAEQKLLSDYSTTSYKNSRCKMKNTGQVSLQS